MHVVIVGAGAVGSALARSLVTAGHEIAVIDQDRARCVELEEALGSVTVLGNGTDSVVLTAAGVNRADLVVATTSMDDVNLVICRLAKDRFGVQRTISLVHDREHTELFGLAGVDTTVDVTELLVGRIQEGVSTHGFVHLMPVPGREARSLVNFHVPVNSSAAERRLRDLSLPNGTVIALIISRDGTAAIPTDDTSIRPGDELVAVTTPDEEETLGDLLTQVDE